MKTINFAALDELIRQQKWGVCPAELHGIVSALCAFGTTEQWAQLLALDPETSPAKEVIPRLIEQIENALQKSDPEFSLLLPPDGALAERAQALAFWAGGFSLVRNYLREEGLLPALDTSSEEFLHDIAEIAKLDALLPENEENRRLLRTLEEHGAMATLLLYTDRRQPR